MISLGFALLLIAADDPAELDYGEVFFEETRGRELPKFNLGVAYAAGVSNSFLDLHSVVANGQVRVWRYISTGVLGHFVHSTYSEAGQEVNTLNNSGYIVRYPTPRWGVFSHSQIDLMLGRWNILNLTTIQVDLLVGGGVGLLQKRNDLNGPSHSEVSYLWSAEQRFQVHDLAGFSLGGFGHAGGVFLEAGLFANLF